MVRIRGPDSSGMRVSDRRNKHIALKNVNRRGRDEREESSEGREDTEEEKVREGVRELHDGCVMRNSLSGWFGDDKDYESEEMLDGLLRGFREVFVVWM